MLECFLTVVDETLITGDGSAVEHRRPICALIVSPEVWKLLHLASFLFVERLLISPNIPEPIHSEDQFGRAYASMVAVN